MTALPSIIESKQIGYWKDWIGHIEWDRTIKAKQRLLIHRIPSQNPMDDDGQNVALNARSTRAWLAWMIPPPNRPWGCSPWMVTGVAADDQPQGLLRMVRNFSRQLPVVKPFYATQDVFRRTGPQEPTFETWLRFDDLLSKQLPPILNVAIGALQGALARAPLEARIPDFVRAAEGILALPRSGGGAKVFAERALKIAPSLKSNWFVGANVEQRLIELYGHRNDCVHGKIPFEQLHIRGASGAEDAARFEYLAELLARECLAFAILSPWPQFATRATLEGAWDSGAIP